jgi:RNA polymerase sigma-70 factor (ECF subfamily)
VERIEPSGQAAEDADTARLVARIQGGDTDAFALLYMRYFDRVYSYLRVLFKDPHDAEDAAQQVFIRVMEALPAYEDRVGKPFRAWLFTVVRNYALRELRTRGRTRPTEPEALERGREDASFAVPDVAALSWLTDRDLMLFVERLPLAQRQVLMLRYMVDLPLAEIAAVLGRSHDDVRQLHSRALAFLRDRLAALGRTSLQRTSDKVRMRRATRQNPVMRARRFSLLA